MVRPRDANRIGFAEGIEEMKWLPEITWMTLLIGLSSIGTVSAEPTKSTVSYCVFNGNSDSDDSHFPFNSDPYVFRFVKDAHMMTLIAHSESEQIGHVFSVDTELDNVSLDPTKRLDRIGMTTSLADIQSITLEGKPSAQLLISISVNEDYLTQIGDEKYLTKFRNWEFGYASGECAEQVRAFLEKTEIPLTIK